MAQRYTSSAIHAAAADARKYRYYGARTTVLGLRHYINSKRHQENAVAVANGNSCRKHVRLLVFENLNDKKESEGVCSRLLYIWNRIMAIYIYIPLVVKGYAIEYKQEIHWSFCGIHPRWNNLTLIYPYRYHIIHKLYKNTFFCHEISKTKMKFDKYTVNQNPVPAHTCSSYKVGQSSKFYSSR